jgi:hypothetical protein
MNKQLITRENLRKIHDVACTSWKNKLESYATRNPFQLEIELTQSEIDEMFKASDSNQTKLLKTFFTIPADIRDKVKSFLDACNILNIDHKSVYSTNDSKDDVAFKKLKVIIKALNEGWWPNWENENEYKYMNYWRMKGGFAAYDTAYYLTATIVPSALCLKSNELALHAAEIAKEEYREYYS